MEKKKGKERHEYPAIANDPQAKPIIKEMNDLKDRLYKQQLLLNHRVVEIQMACPHTEFDENRGPLHTSLHKTCLLSKTCKDCGRDFPKPEGKRHEVCENCWGTMKFSHRSSDGDRRDFYKCTSCHHVYSET